MEDLKPENGRRPPKNQLKGSYEYERTDLQQQAIEKKQACDIHNNNDDADSSSQENQLLVPKLVNIKHHVSIVSPAGINDCRMIAVATSSSSMETSVSPVSSVFASSAIPSCEALSVNNNICQTTSFSTPQDSQRKGPELESTVPQPCEEAANDFRTGATQSVDKFGEPRALANPELECCNAFSQGAKSKAPKTRQQNAPVPASSGISAACSDSQHAAAATPFSVWSSWLSARDLGISKAYAPATGSGNLHMGNASLPVPDELNDLERELGIRVRDRNGAVDLHLAREARMANSSSANCLACKNNPPDVKLMPCHHWILCSRCYLDPYFEKQQDMPCPACRQTSEGMYFTPKMCKLLRDRK